MEKGKQQALTCLHGETAFCTAACPFGLDVRDFIVRMQRGRMDAAYRIFRDAAAFPMIVAALCPAPCQKACIRTKIDDAIQLHALERAVCRLARNTGSNRYNVPKKQGHIAIVGGGISGLACALRLCMRKYDVTIYEKTDRIGGHLYDLLPEELFLNDIKAQFQYEDYTLRLNTEIKSLDELSENAVYVATGQGGENFGLLQERNGLLTIGHDNVLLGGSLAGTDTMGAIAQGLQAANAIEAYLKVGRMGEITQKQGCTNLRIDETRLVKTPKIVSMENEYTADEAAAEASRCLRCDCDACQRTCDLMGYYGRFPKHITEEVEGTIHPSALFANRMATRLIGSCTHCGICKETCPMHIDMQSFLLESRRIMERMGDMPKPWSAFWLQDMAHANGERAALNGMPEGKKSVRYAFFPGCQLGASDVRYVQRTYEALLSDCPDTGLMLGCCGAPAYWAGQEELHGETIDHIRSNWLTMGKPTLLFTCPTCKKLLKEFLPEIDGEFAYPFLLNKLKEQNRGQTVSVFDPCSSRHESEVQEAVRTLLEKSGHTLAPLPYEKENAQCCGYGGQTIIANPRMAQQMVKGRIEQSPHPYVTYCTNCRDTFAAQGKQAMHVLDVVFGLDDGTRKPPTWTKRRENRESLRQWMLTYFHKEAMDMHKSPAKVLISDELMQKMQQDYILKEDIEQVVAYCQRTGAKLSDPKTGHYIGHLRMGYMTFWVEYATENDGFVLCNAYAHRMQIQEDEECKKNSEN